MFSNVRTLYTPKTIFIPATLLFITLTIGLLFATNFTSLYESAPHSKLLAIATLVQMFAAFLIGYYACYVQFSKFKYFGFLLGSVSFGLALYYQWGTLNTIKSSPGIDSAFLHLATASLAILLLVFLSDFQKIIKYSIITTLLLFVLSLVTSRGVLSPDVLKTAPFFERFVDISFWNFSALVACAINIALAFLITNIVFEKFKLTQNN